MFAERDSSAVIPPSRTVDSSEFDLTNSRKMLKPVILAPKTSSSSAVNNNDENVNLSPRKRILLQVKSNNKLQLAKQSFGSRLNKKLSLRKNQDPGSTRQHISDKIFKRNSNIASEPVVNKIEKPARPIQQVKPIKTHNNVREKEQSGAKHILFSYEKARITCFESGTSSDKTLDSANDSFEFLNFNSKSSVLGHGSIEIYSIHDKKEVNYLQCGTVIYPMLRKMKILRIGLNKFVMPLSNPERYWLISLKTKDESILNSLQSCLVKTCSFRNLYVPIKIDSDDEDDTQIEDKEDSNSVKSISTDLACFNIYKTDSNQSSLDLELDKFEETMSNHYIVGNTMTPLTMLTNQSGASSIITDFAALHKVKHKYSNNTNITDLSIHRKPSLGTLRSKNSLYQLEPSWMSIDDDVEYSTTITSNNDGFQYDRKTLTNTILYQNLNRLKQSQSLTKLSQEQILGLVKYENYNDETKLESNNDKRKSTMRGYFGW